jgi:hypothetical protein
MPTITVQNSEIVNRFNDYKRKKSASAGKDLNNDAVLDQLLKEVRA